MLLNTKQNKPKKTQCISVPPIPIVRRFEHILSGYGAIENLCIIIIIINKACKLISRHIRHKHTHMATIHNKCRHILYFLSIHIKNSLLAQEVHPYKRIKPSVNTNLYSHL